MERNQGGREGGRGDMCWLVILVKLTQTRVIWEKETSTEKMPLVYWPVYKPVYIFIDDVGGPSSWWAVLFLDWWFQEL